MRTLIWVFFALEIGSLTGWSATGHTKVTTSLILPGTSVAEVKLGDDASRFEVVFSKPPTSQDHSLTGTTGVDCPTEIYYWSDLVLDTSVLTAYLKNGEISQFSAQGPRFSLTNGIKTGATEELVKQVYPKGQMYVLLFSGNKVNGGRDLHYWVDKEAGIAFKLAWWQSKKQRFVSGIDIFPKSTDYQPDGCVSPPQQWQQLK